MRKSIVVAANVAKSEAGWYFDLLGVGRSPAYSHTLWKAVSIAIGKKML